MVCDPRVRYIFVQIGIIPYLHLTHSALMHERDAKNDRSMLLSACRKALVCTEESVINSLGKDLSYMLDSSRRSDAGCFVEAHVRFDQLDNLTGYQMYA